MVSKNHNSTAPAKPTHEGSELGTRKLARQPIFDPGANVVAYEMLARRGSLDTEDRQNHATDDVIEQIANLGEYQLASSNKPAFINLTRNALLTERYSILPAKKVVLELLEHVKIDNQVIDACHQLTEQGYMLALDDVVDLEPLEKLLPIAKMIKVDFLLASEKQQAELAKQILSVQLTALAEKVETREDFERARDMGYQRFQGYFFQKPEIISRSDVSPSTTSYLHLLSLVSHDVIDFDAVEVALRSDSSMSTRLLRYLRQHATLDQDVSSIKQAVVMLGEEPLRRWTAVLGVTVLGQNQPTELLIQSLTRGNFCEQLANTMGMADRKEELFLLGLLSLMDVMASRPMDELLMDMPLGYDLRVALLGSPTLMGQLLHLARACERNQARTVQRIATDLGMMTGKVWSQYYQASAWADFILLAQAG